MPSGAPLSPEDTLSAGNVVEIGFPSSSEFDDKLTVSQDGTVAPKRVGSVAGGGVTAAEATRHPLVLYGKKFAMPRCRCRALLRAGGARG